MPGISYPKENIMTFTESFISDTVAVLSKVNHSDVRLVIDTLAGVKKGGGRLFLCGSGGGAGHASHATCDFRKMCNIEAYCVTDNVSELTARTNDDCWETSYAEWLRASRFSASDCLFVFSVGGGSINPPVSVNLVKAITYAKSISGRVVGIVGRDGGTLRELADASILIPSEDTQLVTPQTEGLQAVFWHLIVSSPSLCANTPKWESLVD